MSKKNISLILIVMFLLFMTTILYSQSVPAISSNRMVDWSNAGLLDTSPIYADNVFNIQNYSGNDDDKIDTAITLAKNAAGISIIYFPAGSYYFNIPIELHGEEYSNIIFQGEGSDITFLNFAIGKDGRCFTIYSDELESEYLLSSGISKSSNIIEGSWAAPPIGPFGNDDWIYLCEYNHPKCIDQGLVGQITQLTSISTNQALMKDEASKSYNQNNTLWIRKFVPIQNIGIENLTINGDH